MKWWMFNEIRAYLSNVNLYNYALNEIKHFIDVLTTFNHI